MNYSSESCCGVILSGGAGTRMGGLDKGLQQHNGKALVCWVIDSLREQVPEMLIVANRNLEEYQRFGYTVISDKDIGYQGPLAGLIAAADYLQTRPDIDSLLVASCDVPNLSLQFYRRLSAARQGQPIVAVAHDGERAQHLHCLIPRELWPSLKEYYNSGQRSVHGWLAGMSVSEVDFSDHADTFFNINRLNQLNNDGKSC